MAKKTTDTISIGFEDKIWKAADVLRGNLNAAEYEGVVLGLIFLKYISDKFEEKYAELLADEYADEEDKDEYMAENVFFVPKEARWSEISKAAHTPEVGIVIDKAMTAIETENLRLKGILPKNFARPELDKRRLGDVVDLFTNIKMHDAGDEKDLLGRTYEYCLQQFASMEGKRGGEFYTPSCIVRTIVEILEPYEGDAFMEELAKMKEKNLAVEILTKLLKERITKATKVNVVQSDLFSDMLNKSLSNYLKGLLTNEEVIKELLEMAQKIKEAEEKGDELGLTTEEKAFYDALSTPEGVRQAYNDEEFVALTRELTEALHKNRTIDWNHKESARAKMRVMVKRLLKKYKYPPEGAQQALEIVMRQCEQWADNDDNYYIEPPKHRAVVYSMPDNNADYRMAAEDNEQ